VAPLPALTVPLGFLPRVATTTAPLAVTDGPPPRTWPTSPVIYVRREVGASAAGTRGTPGAALRHEVGAGAVGTLGASGPALSREVGAGAAGTRGAPRAALRQEVGAGAPGTRGAPGATLHREVDAGAMGTCGSPGTALPFVLIWSLYAGVSDPQGTDSGPRAHPERGCEPTGRANSSTPRSVILNFFTW
jgi:hypothetical protein